MTRELDLRPFAVYRRLLSYTAPHWKIFLVSTVGMAIAAATEVGFMSLMKPLLDGSFVHRDPEVIRWVPWAIVGLFLLRGSSSFTATYGMAWIARMVVRKMRGELFDHLLVMPTRFYDRVSSGHLIARLTFHVEQVADAATTALTSIVKDGLTVIGLIGLMFHLNWKLATFTLTVAPLIALIVRYVSKRFRRVSGRIQENMGIVTQAAEESIAGQRVVKIHNAQGYESGHFREINERARYLAMKIVATKAGSDAVIQFIAAWAVAAIVYFATDPDLVNEITPGTFVSFMGAMLSLMNPIRSLSNVNEKLQRGIAAATDLFGLMAEEREPSGGSERFTRARGEVEFRDVRFRYREELGDALKSVSLTVKAGETVAFVGRSGSGKSTLLSLVPRFYDPDDGAVLMDGHDLREMSIDSVRAQIALVDQQVRLFSGTVAENIAYGLSPMPDRARIEAAARQAHAWEFVEKLPQGLDTPIGQNGAMLSGG
ncbi:MAG TPA: ABC transporter transmembrane domain-containing protein, partial [Nevskiaceae bacterium]|nr:ABC transporter transmembrane domain-containing protein [Nevskiaceae bacterium]